MTTTSHQRAGAAIAILAAFGSVIGLMVGHVSSLVAVGIAVIGIVIGTGVARGKFSSAPNARKRN
ncbi:MAG: hypothetical protein WCA27_22835 [Candidatus Sulfotelmatobacter sp.]